MSRILSTRFLAVAVVLVAALAVIVAGTTSGTEGDVEEWCQGYEDLMYAFLDYELADPGSLDQEGTVAEIDAIVRWMYELDVPTAIEDDWAIIAAGPDPSDAGERHHGALERSGEWLINNCAYSAEVVELLETRD